MLLNFINLRVKSMYPFLNLLKIESLSFPVEGLNSFIIQLAKTGTNVCDNKNEAIIAKPTDNDKGKNIEPGTPDMKNAGTKTARIHNIINNFGNAISLQASIIAILFGLPNS